MKILKISKKTLIHCYLVLCLMVCIFLTGCRDRDAEFLAEIQTFEEKSEEQDFKEETSASEEQKEEAKQEEAQITPELPVEIYVDVCGAVARPGVFQLREGCRVFEAIEAAGGYLPEAAQGYINQAEILKDGQQIRIPTEEEVQKGMSSETVSEESAVIMSNRSPEDGRVNINHAGVDELSTLTGIGETRAKAIISYREINGPFVSVEQIMEVEGIKAGTFAKIKDEIIAE